MKRIIATGYVMNIQKEDGSGKCFNVTMLLTKDYLQMPRAFKGETITFFTRIND